MHNLAALERAGSRTITEVRRFVRPRPLHRVLLGMARLRGRSTVRLVELSGADPLVAAMWERASENVPVMPVRDPAHYAWRFGVSPSVSKSIVFAPHAPDDDVVTTRPPNVVSARAASSSAGRSSIVKW